MKKSTGLRVIDIAAVQSRMLTIRNQQVLLDRDVAALYGVETGIGGQSPLFERDCPHLARALMRCFS